jgi:hypothetical protein
MRFGGELVAGQGVADQDGVAARRIERAVGLIRDRDRAQLGAAVERKRPVDREPDAMAGQARGVQIHDRQFGRRAHALHGGAGFEASLVGGGSAQSQCRLYFPASTGLLCAAVLRKFQAI